MIKSILIFLISFTVFFTVTVNGKTKYDKFYDESRKREIPYKVYYPDELKETYPVIIFSHGLGGSVEAAEYLGEHLSQNGYICFHIQHQGSDESIWKGILSVKEIIEKLKESLKDYKNAENRFLDVPFVTGEIIKLNRNSDLFKGHLDTINIGIIGHSYGARSVLVASGEKIAKGRYSFKVPGIKAGVALSPNIPDNPPNDLSILYEDINIPIFHITGTEDGDPLKRKSDFTPPDRTKPYKNITTSTQFLLVQYKATHSTFNGKKNEDPYLTSHIEDLKSGVTAFLNYYLKKNETDGEWLKNEYKKTLDSKDTFEWKEKK